MVRNGILSFLYLPRNASERNSERFSFRETDGIPTEWIKISVCSVFRGIIFFSENGNVKSDQDYVHPPLPLSLPYFMRVHSLVQSKPCLPPLPFAPNPLLPPHCIGGVRGQGVGPEEDEGGGGGGKVEGENGLPFNLFVTMRPNWKFPLIWPAGPLICRSGVHRASHFPLSSEQSCRKISLSVWIFKVLCHIGSFFRFSESYIIYYIVQYGYIFFWGGGGGVYILVWKYAIFGGLSYI